MMCKNVCFGYCIINVFILYCLIKIEYEIIGEKKIVNFFFNNSLCFSVV